MSKNLLLLLSIIMFSACNSAQKQTAKTFDLQGHRGCRGLFPENSIEGFIQAVNLGVNTIELDVVITADSQVVVSHEPWMGCEICLQPSGKEIDSAEEKHFNIYKMKFAELKDWDCGSKPHPRFQFQQKMKTNKPLLSEVFKTIEQYLKDKHIPEVKYNIEIKSSPEGDNIYHPSPSVFCKLVTEQIEKFGLEKRSIIQSFDNRTLRVMHDKYPRYNLALLVEPLENPKSKLSQLGFKIEILSPNFRMVDSALVSYCFLRKMQIIPWTVNEEEDMKRMLALGVDGIITDYPDLAATLR